MASSPLGVNIKSANLFLYAKYVKNGYFPLLSKFKMLGEVCMSFTATSKPGQIFVSSFT
jgi:adenosine/AMP kinase